MVDVSKDEAPSETEVRLEAAKAANPKRRLYVAESPAGTLILGAPRGVDFAAYRTMILGDDPTEKAKAPDMLLIACAVDPGPADMKLILADYVGIAGNPDVAGAVAKAIGTSRADAAKK
jgi:hypothetical protein